MAIYSASFKTISRKGGRSIVAAAAYRAGERIVDERQGVVYDYSRKSGIVFKKILLPENAPSEYEDRATLWNAVERAESASDSRLGREWMLALPVELDLEQQTEVVCEFARKNITELGMCADITIHNPTYRDDLKRPIDADGNLISDPAKFLHNNPHAHILLTARPIGKNGKWEAKTQKEYVCKRGEEQQNLTGEEFKKARLYGWEKQFRYIGHDGTKVWLTPSEAEEKGLDNSDRVNRSPRSTPHGRKNPTVEYWNDSERVREWRKSWEEILNQKFEELGLDVRVDSRSYKEQGIDKIPGVHMGSYVNTREKRARRLAGEGKQSEYTDVGSLNRVINEHNKSVELYNAADKMVTEKARYVAGRMEHLISDISANRYMSTVLGEGVNLVADAAKNKEGDDINVQFKAIDAAGATIEKTGSAISAVLDELAEAIKADRREYRELQQSIPKAYQSRVDAERTRARETEEQRAVEELKTKLGDRFSPEEYQAFIRQTEKSLDAKPEREQHKGRSR